MIHTVFGGHGEAEIGSVFNNSAMQANFKQGTGTLFNPSEANLDAGAKEVKYWGGQKAGLPTAIGGATYPPASVPGSAMNTFAAGVNAAARANIQTAAAMAGRAGPPAVRVVAVASIGALAATAGYLATPEAPAEEGPGR
jgi:hypothetical protein